MYRYDILVLMVGFKLKNWKFELILNLDNDLSNNTYRNQNYLQINK